MSSSRLNGIVQKSHQDSLGFESDRRMPLDVAQKLYQQGYRFCVRQIPLDSEDEKDLSYEEANDILGSGLALMPVQYAPEVGWSPFAALGTFYGETAAASAAQVGFPPKVNVWCKLADVSTSARERDVIEHCNAWYDAVSSWGYVPSLYVGANSILDGEQLSNLKFKHFWRAEGHIPAMTDAGYQMLPSELSTPVNNVGIRRTLTCNDRNLDRMQWLVLQ